MPAVDMAASVDFYKTLGFTLIVDAMPRYVRFLCPSGDSTLSLHKTDALQVQGGVVVYFECDDLDAEVERLLGRGITFTQLPVMQSWLWQEAHLSDPAGNSLILFNAGQNRKDPPWRVN